LPELPGYAAAIHPNGECWAWSGRSSKLGIRRITDLTPGHEDSEAHGNGNGNGIGRGALAGTGAVVDTGKGKFGMDVKFVSLLLLLLLNVQRAKLRSLVTRRTIPSCLYGSWADCSSRHRDTRGRSYLRITRNGRPINLLVTRFSGTSASSCIRCLKLTSSGYTLERMISVSSYTMFERAQRLELEERAKEQLLSSKDIRAGYSKSQLPQMRNY
jgi:hypothetical protein